MARRTRNIIHQGIGSQKVSEALADIALAHTIFGLNCAALSLLGKARDLSGEAGNTSHFLNFCFGMAFYYYSKHGDRTTARHHVQLCIDYLTPLTRHIQYKMISELYLWKIKSRITHVLSNIPPLLISKGYARYLLGKECVRGGESERGVTLLRQSLSVCQFPDTYYWLGEGSLQLNLVREGCDVVWREMVRRCPAYVNPPNNEQESGVSPPPPTAVSSYRKIKQRRLAITSPSGNQASNPV